MARITEKIKIYIYKNVDTGVLDYFTEKLEILIRDMGNYTPAELARSLGRLAMTANSETMREPEGARSLLVECERALCCPDPAQRQVTASKVLRMLAASTAPAVQGEPVALAASAQKPVGYVSQDFLDGKWSLDHIAKSDEGQISRTIPVFAKPPQHALSKYQPCGCVICTCEHETQCQGCGAKHCGTHPVGQLPAPAYIQPAEQQPDPFRGDNAALIRSAQSLLRLDDKGAFGPNGIGGHARNIITAFIARISADQQPAPDVTVLVDALERVMYCNEVKFLPEGVQQAVSDALAARRKGGGDE